MYLHLQTKKCDTITTHHRMHAVKETTEALKRHSKRDVLCCWRNGLWAVSRCIKKLQAARLSSLTSTLYVTHQVRY